MELETLFRENDIKDIYDLITIYSILKYNNLEKEIQLEFEEGYKNTIKNFKERNLETNKLSNYNLETLEKRLKDYNIVYETNIKLNKDTINDLATKVEHLIITRIQEEDEITRISFLFDFITNYINYSEENFKYCLNVPFTDNFSFDFSNNVPVDNRVQGLLVQRQGVCDDISNLIIYLGNCLNLNIKKIFCTYNNNLHCLNCITLNDGKNYLIDATRVIRKDKTKEECFLVSEETINKDKKYEFIEDMIKTTNYDEYIPNKTKEALLLINTINRVVLNPNNKKNRR